MALVSPGVEVSIINESMYAEGNPGTVPLIVMATGQDKYLDNGAVAKGTQKENANKLYIMTSQSELVNTFGKPSFEVDDIGNVVQGGEINEYGLWTAYSYLGAMNRAYVIRADLDLQSLASKDMMPVGKVANGSFWLDPTLSKFGLKISSGSTARSWVDVEPVAVGSDIADYDPETYNLDDILVIIDQENSKFTYHRCMPGLEDTKIWDTLEVNYVSDNVPVPTAPDELWVNTAKTANGMDIYIKQYNATNDVWVVRDYVTNRTKATKVGDLVIEVAPAVMGTSETEGIIYITTAINPVAVAALSFTASATEPFGETNDQEIWFDERLYADVMINDGTKYCGLHSPEAQTAISNVYGSASSNIGVHFAVLPPTPADNDPGHIWINTSDLDALEYNVWNGSVWFQLDSTDQSTFDGLAFLSLRDIDLSGTESEIEARITTKMTENVTDVGQPEAYPAGMFAINVKAFGNVVKQWNSDTQEWKLLSGTDVDGSLTTGRKAQRKVVVEAMAESMMVDDLRAETIEYSLIVTPGYFELLDESIALNQDRKETAYIITDVPARLTPDATSINAWAKNENNAASNGDDGRVSSYDYAAQYYGWGMGTNVDGKEVVIPPSAIALRTYAYNDTVSYLWFPPAGYQRGLVSNAASTGYINKEGEYVPAVLGQGQRDVMYTNNINPITYRPGRGLVVYGDKSLSPITSALDRVNVGRLVCYIRTQVAKIGDKYTFTLNTETTRGSLQGELSSFLSQILEQDGLYDFAVVCNTSNNTPARIDRNELWADVMIQPTKSVNFVYVPIRLQNTGE